MIVVDTNIISYLYLSTNQTRLVEQVLQKNSRWAAPLLWRSEFRSVLALYVRKKIISLEKALAIQQGHLSRLLWHDFGTYVYILQ